MKVRGRSGISEDEKVHSKSGKKYIFPMVFHSEDLAVCEKIPEQALIILRTDLAEKN